MKFLIISDVHDEEAVLDALDSMYGSYDKLLICGDIGGRLSFAKDLINRFPNCFLVPGNYESKEINEYYASLPQCIHGKRAELGDGLNIVGFGYSNITPFGTYGELTEDKIYQDMEKLPIDSNTLLLLHCPPKGHFDEVRGGHHAGSTSILKIIEQKKPFAAFFGHIHEHMGTEIYNGVQLVKVPAADSIKAVEFDVNNKKAYVHFIGIG